MSQKQVRAIYETRLATWAAARAPALPIVYENDPLTPPATTYLRAFLLPADTTSEDLAGTLRTYGGIFQVNVVAPINTGPGAAAAIGDELAALFVLNARLTGGVTVQQITPTTVAGALQDADRYTIPVYFSYRSDTN